MNAVGPGPAGGSGGRRRTPDLRFVRGLPIEAGEVACPQRGVVAARCCFACTWFAGAELDGPEPAMRCAFLRQLVVEEPGPLGLRLARAWRREGSAAG